MPNEKQIDAAQKVFLDARPYMGSRELATLMLTAAEQAEPLANDVEVHRWQRATAAQSRKLQMVLDIPGVKERLQEVTGSSDGYMLAGIEQAEPAPNTLVDTISDEVWGHDASKDNCLVVDSDGLSEPAPAALEPAEPATDAEPVAWSYEVANYIDNDGSYTGWVGPRLSFQKPNAPEGAIRNVTPLYTRPSENQLRELIATLLPHLNLTSPGALDLMKEAMRVLGGPDAVR